MKGKINKKTIVALMIVGLLALCALGSWFIWKSKQQPVIENPIEEVEEDTTTAAVLVLDYNNVSLGLNHSFTVQAKTYWEGEEVGDQIEYTWEMDEEGSADVASMEASGDSATITGLAYGDTAYTVSANYRGTLLVKKLSVHVGNLDVIFDSPNMELSAGCYTVNLGLLETETDVTSMIPEIYVYDNEELVKNPEFTWTNSDESIAVRDANGRITAKKAGSTLIIGKYKESEIHIRVNVHRTQIEADPAYIESYRNYALSFSKLKGMDIEEVLFNDVNVLKGYNKNSGTITFDSSLLPEIGSVGKLLIRTEKMEMVMEAMVCTMALHNETDLNKMASVIEANKGEGYYVLAKDIRCTGTYDAGITVEFVGTFDGRGNAIYNMTTSDRDGNNRGLLGTKIAKTGVVKNVSFVGAKHGGKGAFIAMTNQGTMKNLYIQIDITSYNSSTYDNATSVLGSNTSGNTSTQNVLIEYMNPLPADATNGYALWQLYHGYAKHQGLYVIGAGCVANREKDLGAGLKDIYGAYQTYGDFLAAGIDVTTWENDFWTVQNGIPYPVKLAKRTGTVPNVSIPEYVAAGTNVTLNGATIYDRVVLSAAAKKLGITVKGNVLNIPKTVSAGTKIKFTVQSVFDASKKTTVATTVLAATNITLPGTYDAELYKQTTFSVNFGSTASKVAGAELFYVTVDGKAINRKLYTDGILTLDTASLEGFGAKTVEATFKKGNKLIIVTIPIDVCTMAINDETDLNDMASVISANDGKGRYVLAKNIVCTGTYDAYIATEFNGVFDGRGYAIYNMTTSDRDGNNRGLLGSAMGKEGVVENVAFLNASHGGKGAFIATTNHGTMKNLYIQIDITSYNSSKYNNATTVLGSNTMGNTSTQNVLIEYINPLPADATNGYALWQLYYGYAKHQGLYVIGADKVGTTSQELAGGLKDIYGAFRNYGDYLSAGTDLTTWANDFWAVYNKIPYPKNLEARVGTVPAVTIPKYVGNGSNVVLDGLTLYDRVILGSDMTKLGITVKDGILSIPKNVPLGTVLRITVESVFDSSKKTTLQATVYETVNVTLKDTYDVVTYNATTFDIDFGTQASAVENGTLISATVGNSSFAKATYTEGILTLDTSTLTSYGEQVVTVVFDKDNKLVTVTIHIDVTTMVIKTEEDLNNMASVIAANEGAGRYVLGQDIHCEGVYDANITTEFKGTFDGRGYTIYNMTTSDRDGKNRGLLGSTMDTAGVVQNVSFVNASHGGKGAFIAMTNRGTMKNVYIQIDITSYNSSSYDNATSVLGSNTGGNTSTQNVLIEYINPLPADATNGYALWQMYYGYGKHQGFYVVGADSVCQNSTNKGTVEDVYGAFGTYGDFVSAENDLTTWANHFWTVTNGIPYPTHLGKREGVMPVVTIPSIVGPGSNVVLDGLTMFDRVLLDAEAKELGITVSDNTLNIPESVPSGTTVNLTVQSVFDETKKIELTTEILTSKNVELDTVTIVEVYNHDYFTVDLTALAAEIGDAALVSAAVDSTSFVSPAYEQGILTLDTISLAGWGDKTVSVTFKGTENLISITLPIEVCTMAIDSEEDLNAMPAAIVANNGAGRYILTADITCEGTYDANISTAFIGTFDGCGHTIYNMTTSDRDGKNRGLLGSTMDTAGVVQNVSFVNASHGGKGAFIAMTNRGTMKNLYIQINITSYNSSSYDNATSVLGSNTGGNTSTQNVLIEYINPLPSDATNGYALWQMYYGYGKHQGFYAVGADSVCQNSTNKGAVEDVYGAFGTYSDFVSAENDLTTWANDFWTVTNGIPYPTRLGTREAVVPEVSIPSNVAQGSNVVIEGVKVYEKILLDEAAQACGITVTGNVVSIPDTVEIGTEVRLTVVSIFDTSKSTALKTIVNGLTEITWADFAWNNTALVNGQSFDTDRLAKYSGTTLNNTAFEGDVSIPSGSGFRYAAPSSWYGLTIQESSGKLLISGKGKVAVNGKTDTAYTLDAEDYGLTTFTDKRFTIRIELYDLSSDNLSATLNIYINGKTVGEGITLTGSSAHVNYNLGTGIGFAQNGLAGGITIYDVRPALTEITWADFAWNNTALVNGQSFDTDRLAKYSGTTLNNTAFEGDVSIPSGSGFRYAAPSSWYGLTVQESSGKLLISGKGKVAVNGKTDTAYTLDAEDYGLTTFTDKRFTIRIELYDLSSDNLSATLNIYINGKTVGEGITLTGSSAHVNYNLGTGIGFAQNGLAGGITIYDVRPALTEITWADFAWNNTALVNGQSFDTDRLAKYSGTTLNNTAFEGDVSIPSGSGFRYAVPSSWYGLTIQESSGKLLIGGKGKVAVNGKTDTAYTLDAEDYGLTTFTDKRFTIRIELYDLSSDNLSATLNIYINGKTVGEGITLTGSSAHVNYNLGTGIGFAQNGLAGGITIYEI